MERRRSPISMWLAPLTKTLSSMENAEQPPVVKGSWKRCAFLIALLGGLMFLLDRWFFPWLGEISARANCIELAGINGSVVLFAALFVGLPFSVFLFTVWLGFYSRKILRAGQLPLPDAWVCRDPPNRK